MKKIVVICIFAVFIPVFAFSQMSLDTALRNSTSYLNLKVPAKSKLVVLNFSSNWPQLSDYIIEELIGYIVNDGNFSVIDRANLETIRKEMNFQLSGDVSDETAQSVGKMLGAQTIISGAMTAIGSTYRLRIRAISVETAQIQGMQNIDVAQDSRSAALTGTVYTGPVTTAVPASQSNPSAKSTPVAKNAPAANSIVLADILWVDGIMGENATLEKNTTVSRTIAREVIDGHEREVLTVNIDLGSSMTGWRYGLFYGISNALQQKMRGGSGVRFKILGNGKTWIFLLATKDVTDSFYQTLVATKKGKVVAVDIPYSKLKQPSWSKMTSFNKSNIDNFCFMYHSDPKSSGPHQTGLSSIKIFDFEIY
ncbi:MAG: CsgG/HfaB family protein [Treponema sp.]|jgi:TolB-like protein|nr:CsgG/HfaB family protein [Treponema sp.]